MRTRSSLPLLVVLLAGACTRSFTTDAGRPDAAVDLPPIAVLADRTARVGELVQLSGADSHDPEGAPLAFSWSLRHRPEGSLATLEPAGQQASIRPDTIGVFAIDLSVSDGRHVSPRATALVLVGDVAALPVARAGADVTIPVGTTVTLDGSASTSASGGPLHFVWELVVEPAGGAATLSGATTATPELARTSVGEHVLSLVVHDGAFASMPDLVRVEVLPGPPIDDPVARGELDPGEVYLAGTLSEGACYRDALAHPERPDIAVSGFDCDFSSRDAMLTADGTLLYTNSFEGVLREFHCDGCPTWTASDSYPSDPLANDTILPTPPCTAEDFRSGVRAFLVGPDGTRIHSCGSAWYRATGEEILRDEDALAVGHDERALLQNEVLDLRSGARAPIGGLPSCTTLGVRAAPATGFLIALGCADGRSELWTVAHDGIATIEGVYPEPPIGYGVSSEHALAADGALVQFAHGPITFEDAIIRRTIAGASELVYTEEMTPSPAVMMHISALVTGP